MEKYDRGERREQGGSGKSPDELYAEAQKLINNGRERDAMELLKKLVTSYPDYALAHNDLGVLSYKQGNKEEALHHYKKAAQLEPYNDTFQKNLADFYFVEAGRMEEAIEIYLEILKRNPTDIETLVIMGQICVSLNKIDDAKFFYNRALELEPWNVDARERLDELEKGVGDY